MLNVVPFLLSRAMQINIIFPMLHNEMFQLVDAFQLQVIKKLHFQHNPMVFNKH